MGRRELIAGPNFSGRSAAMLALLRGAKFARECFYVGPYAEAALSGLSSTIADEIEIYRAKPASVGRAIFAPSDFELLGRREPQTLSGGEQVLLALHCFSLSSYGAIAIDTALEQLDPANRDAALGYLDPRRNLVHTVALIDNRLPPPLLGWDCLERTSGTKDFNCDPGSVVSDLAQRRAPTLAMRGLAFTYPRGRQIFHDVSLVLESSTAYRLAGPNGAGKTTLLKLLVGVLVPSGGEVMFGGARYRPWRDGNRAIALATQNPDHQWCGATLAEDLARRRAAFARETHPEFLAEQRLARLARSLGVQSLDAHLYELPLAARNG